MTDYIPPKPLPTAPWWVGVNVLLFVTLICIGIAWKDAHWYATATISLLPTLVFMERSIRTECFPRHLE